MPKNFKLPILKYLFEIPLFPIYYFSCFIPKKNNIWIFETFNGKKFAENSKYLVLYVKRNHPEIRPILLTRKQRVIEDLRRKDLEIYKTFSLKSFFYSMQAACVIVSWDIEDVNPFVIGRAKKINLWHGIAPKKGDYEEKTNFFKFLAKVRNKIFPFINPNWDAFITTSEENKKFVSFCYLAKNNSFTPITGYPRDDALSNAPWLLDNKCSQLEDIRKKINFKYVFTYLPTHRGGKKKINLFENYGFKIDEVEKSLKDLNAILIIKSHLINGGKFNLSIPQQNPQVIYSFSDDELPDVYPLLKETDVLITDYSSVFADYLLLNRPIIFTPFDINEYEKEVGFHYNYNEITPGPKAKNWQEVFDLIKKIIQKDDWREAREKICKRFYRFKDNKNSERVFKVIKEMLNKR